MEFALIITLVLVILIWFESLRSREYVTRYCELVCAEVNLQLLDQSVVLVSLSISKTHPLCLIRGYEFDVSEVGTDRLKGHLILRGENVESVHITNQEGDMILQNRRLNDLH